jgi:hypothetical protein
MTSPLTLQPDGTNGIDTCLQANAATYNYGIATLMYAGRGVAASYIRHSLLKFDISSLPAGVSVSSAIVSLRAGTGREGAVTDFHRMLVSWFEGVKNGAAPDANQDGSTWNLRNANGSVAWGAAGGQSGTDYAATATASVATPDSSTTYDFDVTADVQAWVAGTAQNYGWLIRGNNEVDNNLQQYFASSDNSTTSSRPKLVITYTSGNPWPIYAQQM